MPEKPKTADWLKRHPEAARRFDLVRHFLLARYTGTNHGYVDLKAYPEYWFNRVGEGSTTICGQKTKTRVRFDVGRSFHQIDIADLSDLRNLETFLKENRIANFHSESEAIHPPD